MYRRKISAFLRRWPRRLPALPALLALLASAPSGHALNYEIVPCCTPCQAVHDRASYNTGFLSLFTMLLQGKDDWLFRSDLELLTVFGPDEESLQKLKMFSDALKKRGTQLVLVYHPSRGLVHPSKVPAAARYDFAAASANYRGTLERLRGTGVIVPDLTPLLGEDHEREFFFRRDHHWTPYGAERTARIVADTLRRHPAYASLEKREFTTRRVGLMRKNGTLQIAWQRLCGDTYADQYVDEFLSEQSSESVGGGADQQALLFGNGKLPEITLIGTSFSKSAYNYNFDGYLKQYLGVDVLNEALAGANYGAFLQYLPGEAFQTQPPKFIIWEIPSYHDLKKGMFYRQVYALLENGCVGKPVELVRTTRLRSGRNEILFNGGGELKTLRGGNYLLDLKFDNPEVSSINATVWYVNGRNERVKIDHGTTVDSRGRFTVALRDDRDWKDFNFLSVDLHIDGPPPAQSITARLCRDSGRTSARVASK